LSILKHKILGRAIASFPKIRKVVWGGEPAVKKIRKVKKFFVSLSLYRIRTYRNLISLFEKIFKFLRQLPLTSSKRPIELDIDILVVM